MDQGKTIKVNAIKNGTVIDHISAGKIRKVLDILHLEGNEVVMVGMNLFSNKIGRKDIIKIENKELSELEANSIALIAPEATLIIIQNYEVVRKSKLQIPEHIDDIITCPNPKCITNSEQIISKFKLTNNKPAQVRCLYCEKKYLIDDVKIKK